MLPKAIYLDLMWSLSNYPWYFSQELEQTLKFIWNHKRPRTAKAILREKNKAGGITFSRFQTALQNWSGLYAVGQHTDQRNRIEPRNTDLTCMVNQFSTKEVRIYKAKKTVSSTSSVGKTRQLRVNQWNLSTLSYQSQK